MLFQIFVRGLFDYRPQEDELIPCSQAGIEFQIGDVLRVGNCCLIPTFFFLELGH